MTVDCQSTLPPTCCLSMFSGEQAVRQPIGQEAPPPGLLKNWTPRRVLVSSCWNGFSDTSGGAVKERSRKNTQRLKKIVPRQSRGPRPEHHRRPGGFAGTQKSPPPVPCGSSFGNPLCEEGCLTPVFRIPLQSRHAGAEDGLASDRSIEIKAPKAGYCRFAKSLRPNHEHCRGITIIAAARP